MLALITFALPISAASADGLPGDGDHPAQAAPLQAKEPEVPFVPTPEPVMNKMLELTAPTSSDVVYDLGCGDGRIVVTAAKRYGARGVGVDIDPVRVSESRQNAERQGVSDKVKIVNSDLFEMDLREATVVTLYLLPDVNLRLRPKLLRELKPGARVASHNYDMGDWTPDRTAEVGNAKVFFWQVPAAVSGTWRFDLPSGSNGQATAATVTFAQRFSQVNGTARLHGQRARVTDVKLYGKHLDMVLHPPRGPALRLRGRVEGAAIDGTIEAPSGASKWSAQRQGASAAR